MCRKMHFGIERQADLLGRTRGFEGFVDRLAHGFEELIRAAWPLSSRPLTGAQTGKSASKTEPCCLRYPQTSSAVKLKIGARPDASATPILCKAACEERRSCEFFGEV